ncbi:MAG TPA: CUAEP/CCAEP-tail radical SAM protein [Vicinamibacterales bacterium]|nr:CUAEP/CCAEP-tail radical SAM protein [Vicinamibacterales bacterium]
MRVLLISTYDLGRQPLGLAAPAAHLRAAGVVVDCVDTSRDELRDEQIRSADLVAFYLPMHTATRLAGPLVDRVRALHPAAALAAYGLYAPLNRVWLRDKGVSHVLGAEAEREILELIESEVAPGSVEGHKDRPHDRPDRSHIPDRRTLPPLSRYAALQMPDGSRRVVGSTDTTRGCKHVCRHCPIVPVYHGRFTAIPVDMVIEDVRSQVAAGAQHISFGDPDFFNGPTHGRRVVERVAREFPSVTYDVTIKIEHLLKHAAMLPLLRDTGCLFITSAVESIDDDVLVRLQKGHTRADFIAAVEICRSAGVALAPTFVPFTPWTTIDGYRELLTYIATLDLVEAVAPIQLAIRLLVTAESKLLELADIRDAVDPFDPTSLTFPWRHRDNQVDRLQQDVMRIVGAGSRGRRGDVFTRIADAAGVKTLPRFHDGSRDMSRDLSSDASLVPPYMTEAWYCCAEPGPEQVDLV